MFSKRLARNGHQFSRIWRLAARDRSTAPQKSVRTLKAGDRLHGYTVEKVEEVPELFLTAVALNHDKTNAKHLHVARDDSNNVFSVAFRTTPMDSTGVPHILEHTTLCGSHKFPVRDPFFKMLNRSLATFMNAMTASDWTIYPFSTQNRKDYNNLLSVYLDAVFYPQLRELDFSQEGWRLEHEDLQDQTSPLVFKGVVYNEMKGVYSSAQNIYSTAVQNQLIPDHTYGVVSGGDPAFIPDLTWQHLKDFHKTHYHPSNSRFCTYGDFPLEEHLQFIDKQYLQHFDRIDPNTDVPFQKRWTQPRSATITCQPDPMAPDPSKQTMTSVSYLLSDITDVNEAATLSIIGSLLVDGELSPFYQALLESNIGSDYAPVTGYDGHTKEGTFSVGLQGIHPSDAERVQQIIRDTIDKVIEEGFEQQRIDAILHRIELQQKHQSSNFGLGISISTASGWIHDGDPTEMLKVNSIVSHFKQQLAADPKFLQKKVKQYFKDNQHQLTMTMSPDEKYEEKRQVREKQKLQECINRLTADDKERVFTQGKQLQEMQMAKEDISCLPSLHISEIDRNIKEEIVDISTIDGVQVFSCEQPTNEVVYVKMMSFLDEVPQEMKPYVPLFSNVIARMGAGVYDYKQLSQEVELYTGGLGASTHVCADPKDFLGFEEGVVFTSHCLERNLPRMFELWTEVFDRYNLRDNDRLLTLIRMTAADMAASLPQSGHGYAMTHSASSLTPSAELSEMLGGVSQVSLMKKIAEADNQSKLLEHLIEIGKEVLNKNNLKIKVNATPTFMPEAIKGVESFLKSLHGTRKPREKVPESHTVQQKNFNAVPSKCHIELPFSVNYMSKSIQTVPYTHEDFSALKVISKLLSWKYLHREIREKGGAYGGGAQCSAGHLSFYSYRDPNSMQTLSVFDQSIEWLASSQFSDQDIEEAKFSVFQQTDKPVPPGQVGSAVFLLGLTNAMRQEARDRLFAVSRSQIVDVANRYLVPGAKPQSVSFLGPTNEGVSKEQGWKVIKE